MWTWILVIGGIVVIILLIIGVIVSSNSERTLVEDRLGSYLEEDESEKRDSDGSYVTDWVSRKVEKTSFGDRMARELARADMKFKVVEYYALIIISIFVVGLLAFLIGGRNIISLLIGVVVGAFLPRIYVKRQQSQRLLKFNDQLGDMLNLMVNGLRAGYSTLQAMEAISKELPIPIADEFHRVVQEIQIGIPMESALDNLIRRIPSDDLDFVITAINVQREVGGNLSEILDTIAFTIRERVRIKGEIRVLTSQVRASGQFLAMIPIILTVFLWFVQRPYFMFFFIKGPWCGGGALALAGFLIAIGYFVMMKIADIEV
ncbi:MAG: type II secretion system F family protein [Anaerolineales bacterium]|nr:type II secretion system F family protein [Anaerolineales bacterium]